MIKEHVSASAITRFGECPANFLTNYDEDRKVHDRNDRSDVGSLVHGAAEEWKRPENGYEGTFEELEECFEKACVNYTFAEPLAAYKRGKELLAKLYKMLTSHPTLPIHMMQVIAVEQELLMPDGTLWQRDGWVLPMKGSIDLVGIIVTKENDDGTCEVTLVIIDHKTGRMKTHDELVNEDIQPGSYMLYARDQLVKMLAEQNVIVKRIVAAWGYIDDGEAVPMYETDFDHDLTHDYIANISRQIVKCVTEWNDFHQKISEKDEAKREEIINSWLVQFEKPNPHCPYCPRKNVCQTFTRMLQYESRIDIVGENVDFDKLWEELTAYNIIAKNAQGRVDEIRSVIPVFMDQEGLSSIPITIPGKPPMEIVANQQTRKQYRIDAVTELLGEEFVLKNARVTDTAIKSEIALIATHDKEKARTLETLLEGSYYKVPGPRPVIAREIKAPKKEKVSKK